MYFHITTILFIILEHINKIFTQGIPMSPCPKMFQYRFDGQEWFGILSVRNPDFGQALHLRVTLTMRGKPTTNYLGEIELLTRGQFLKDTPVLYRIKFPQHHFPPKLLQIAMNNQIVCIGATDHSIFVTQIQLEHTRKFTFLPDDIPIPLTTDYHMPAVPPPPLPISTTTFTDTSIQSDSAAAAATGNIGIGGDGDDDDAFMKDFGTLLPTNMGFDTKHLPLAKGFEKNPMRTTKNICGKIDDRIRFHFLHTMKVASSLPEAKVDKTNTAGAKLLPRIGGASHIPIVTADDPSAQQSATIENGGGGVGGNGSGSTTTIDELPTITRGAWPWLAAIYVNNLTSLAYQCGGTLVSTRVVISAAHCFQIFKQRYTANEVLVFLGRHNLKNWNEEGSLAAPVDDIFIHPDYDRHLNTYDADIAVVMLKHEVRFNTFIRPACMWSGSSKTEYIEGEHGIVVGWGLDVNHSGGGGGRGDNSGKAAASTLTSAVPKIVNAPIVSNDVCFKANDKFRSLSSNRTFCAGVVMPTISRAAPTTTTTTTKLRTLTETKTNKRTPSSSSTSSSSAPIIGVENRQQQQQQQQQNNMKFGPCSGDSGAGLMIYKNNRWMLRGTVSASLPMATIETAATTTTTTTRAKNSSKGRNKTEKSNCNVNQYVIYTDVGKFLDWIFAFII